MPNLTKVYVNDEIYKHIIKQKNPSQYIQGLIKKDMRGKNK